MKTILCKIFGHSWDSGNQYAQYCKRCSAFRVRVVDRKKELEGDACVEWELYK